MGKKNAIIIIVVLLVILIIPTVFFCWKRVEKQKRIMQLRNERYTYMLNIEGEFEYGTNTVRVIEMQVDERALLMDVVLYNEFNAGKELTTEQLLEEYDNFCNNSGTVDGLEALCEFDRADEYDAQEHPVGIYDDSIGSYVQDKYGLENKYQATLAQLEEAAKYAAEEWRQDVEEN